VYWKKEKGALGSEKVKYYGTKFEFYKVFYYGTEGVGHNSLSLYCVIQ
jgi:hypothetical protein